MEEYLYQSLTSLAACWWLFMISVSLTSIIIVYSRYVLEKKDISLLPSNLKQPSPGVSILKPLKGYDFNLQENLKALFTLNYSLYEILFCVESEEDPCVPIVRLLIKEFPSVDAQLLIGKDVVGVNPKINNLTKGFNLAKYDILWVCDSNVYLHPDSLSRSVIKICEPGVMLVHHLPVAIPSNSFGSLSEALYLNTEHAKLYLFINSISLVSCVVGKSNLYRKSDVLRVGGFAQFGKYLAEDNMIAEALFRLGGTHSLTFDICWQPLGNMTLKEFLSRRSRWTRIRKYMVPVATMVEPLTESIVCGLMGWYGLCGAIPLPFIHFFAAHMLLWCLCDWCIFKGLSAGMGIRSEHAPRLRSNWKFVACWILREVAAFPLFLYAVWGSTVEWRSHTFRLRQGGTVEPSEGKGSSQDETPVIRSASIQAHYNSATTPSQT